MSIVTASCRYTPCPHGETCNKFSGKCGKHEHHMYTYMYIYHFQNKTNYKVLRVALKFHDKQT